MGNLCVSLIRMRNAGQSFKLRLLRAKKLRRRHTRLAPPLCKRTTPRKSGCVELQAATGTEG